MIIIKNNNYCLGTKYYSSARDTFVGGVLLLYDGDR